MSVFPVPCGGLQPPPNLSLRAYRRCDRFPDALSFAAAVAGVSSKAEEGDCCLLDFAVHPLKMERERMVERKGAMPIWVWIVGALLVIGFILASYRMIQTRQHLKMANSKIESVEQSAKQAKAEADAQRNELQTKLDRATSEIGQLKSNLDTAQSQLKDKASNLETMKSELDTAKQAADQAKAEVGEQRNELQTKLDQATSEIERLKNEQDKLKESNPPNGNAQ